MEKLLLVHMNSEAFPTWCPGAESNHRHADFQSAALPTELPGPWRERGGIKLFYTPGVNSPGGICGRKRSGSLRWRCPAAGSSGFY